jgi:hypothetical protein
MGLAAYRRSLERKAAGVPFDALEEWLSGLPLTARSKNALWLWAWSQLSLEERLRALDPQEPAEQSCSSGNGWRRREGVRSSQAGS